MPWTEVISFLLLAAVCAAAAQVLAGFSLIGYAATWIASFIGAWGAVWLADALNFPAVLLITINDQTFPLLWAAIGALLLALAVSLLLQRLLLHTIEEVID